MIDRLKLSQRLALIVLLGVLGGMVTLADSIFSVRAALDEGRRAQLQRLVEGGHGILGHYQALEARGELPREQAQREALAQLRRLRFGADGYFWLVDLDRKAILDPLRPEADGQSASAPAQAPDGAFLADSLRVARTTGDGFVEGMWPTPGRPATPSAASYVRLFKPWGWVLGSGSDGKDLESLFMSRALRSGLIGLGASLLLLGGALLVSRSILRQLGGEPEYASEVTQRIAGGDLRPSTDPVLRPAASLVGHLEKMREGLGGMIQDIRSSAAALQGEATGLIAVSERIKASSSTDYESTVWISAAMEEMALNVESVGDSAKATGTHSEEAARMAREGGDMVQQSTREIEQIAGVIGQSTGQIETLLRRTGEISGIAGVIKEISDQTNLLALNAAIEAARAGEQGRGFAVVADEVRKLAERTGQSTAEIAGMIRSIQSETSTFVELMRGIGPQVERNLALSRAAAELLERLNTGATDSVGQIREIAAAMDELREISGAIAGKVEQMMARGEQSSSEIERSHQVSADIAALGDRLAVSVARFEL